MFIIAIVWTDCELCDWLLGAESFLRASSRSASQEIPRLLRYDKVPCRVHKSPPPDPILSHVYQIHSLKFYFHKIHFNIIFLFTPRPSEWSPCFRLSNQNCLRILHLPHARCMSRPSHLCFIILIIFGGEYGAPHYTVSFNLLSLYPSWVQIFS
jgi:hypothetical protein